MWIFPLQSNNMSRVDNWVHPIAHTALSRHFKMSTTKIIFTHFKTYWFFSTIKVSWKWCFVCNGEKKSLLHIAQKEMYLNLQSPLCIFFTPSNLLNIFNSNFNILYIFCLELWGKPCFTSDPIYTTTGQLDFCLRELWLARSREAESSMRWI